MSRILAGNGLFYPIIGFVSFIVFLYLSFGDLWVSYSKEIDLSFMERNGTQLYVDGKAFYEYGWNSYWLMEHAVDYSTSPRIRIVLQAGAKMGLNV